MSLRPTILLTGFGPFPGVSQNATAVLVPRLAQAARERFDDHDVIDEVLPTEWATAPARLTEILNGSSAVLALHFGVARAAQGFEVELVGRNVRKASADARGVFPQTACIIADGPSHLEVTLPSERILSRLSRLGISCRSSHDAGGYLCNTVLYHSLSAARACDHSFLSGFVHVPAELVGYGDTGEDPHPDCLLDWPSAIAGGLEIIAESLECHGEASRPQQPYSSPSGPDLP